MGKLSALVLLVISILLFLSSFRDRNNEDSPASGKAPKKAA